MRRAWICAALACAGLAAGCDGGGGASAAPSSTAEIVETTATTVVAVVETTATTARTTMAPRYPNGAEIVPGYPLVVNISEVDRRVASWLEDSVNEAGQVVALAPGVYRPYNDAQPDLLAYLDGPNDGDCIVRSTYFPHVGGACWDGVQPSPSEP